MGDNREESLNPSANSEKEVGLRLGSMINDKYLVMSLIGSGGMGSVYRVQQVFLGKEFALKVLDLHKQTDVTVRRFQQEARTASQLQHPNLIEVHDFGMLDEVQPYLVMDLVEGQTLTDWLKKSGALPVDYVVSLCIQICFGLLYAHEKGVVHRDIKPGNIMLLHADRCVTEGSVKIVDFGIAKLTQSEDGEIQALTRTGEIFGSPIYMSPEQCKGTLVDRRSDIYSLGCVVFECLTGTPPFLGDSAMATMLKRLSEEPVTLKEASFGREFPPAMEAIVRKMLAVEPDDRYHDLQAVIKDLMALERPEHRIAVSSAVHSKEKIKLADDKKYLSLLACIFAGTVLATATFDRLFVFPSSIAAKTTEEVVLEESLQKKKELLHKKAIAQSVEMNAAFDIKSGDLPRLETVTDSTGGKQQYLIFPTDSGSISIDSLNTKKAQGRFPIQPDSKIFFCFRHSTTPQGVLDKITNLDFGRIEYAGNFFVSDKTIEVLSKVKHLEWLGLRGCDVSSLKPIYENTTITRLELESTAVQSAEILKLKSLSKLRGLSVGPLKDPAALFNGLAKSNELTVFTYKGARTDKDYPGEGLQPDDVAALGKLKGLRILSLDACPKFDDDSLKQILTLKNLETMSFKDCGLTAKSLATFRKFPKLQALHITTAGWSDADIELCHRQPFKVMVKHSKLQSQDLN